jgi:hypothetical protein
MPIKRSDLLQVVMLFVSFLIIYVVFHSPDLMAVDGPFRSCEVFHRQKIFFHGNNHLLYPVNVLTWDRVIGSVLGACEDPLEFARRTQLMNGLAAAASVAVIFILIRGAPASTKIATWTACAFGFSRAFLLHATNAAEPPVGLLLSLLAVAAAATAAKVGRAWPAVLAGVLLAAAMATYQTMILIGPAVLLLCAIRLNDSTTKGVSVSHGPAMRIAGFLAGSAAGVVGIYGWAYSRQGITGSGAQLRRFLTIDGGSAVYGGLSASKAINTPVGLIGNLFFAVPHDYAGIRWLLRNHATDGWPAWLSVLMLITVTGAVALGCLVGRQWHNLGRTQRHLLIVAAVGLLCTLVGPIYWVATYEKLWLQPIGAVVLLVGLSLAILPPSRSQRTAAAMCMTLILVEFLSNSCWVIPNLGSKTPYLDEARRVNGVLREDDLVVYGWDGISVVYSSLYGFGRPQICLPSAAHERGLGVIDDLRQRIGHADSQGHRVFFLGVLDVSEAAWQPFLGARLGVPFHAMDEFRRRCCPVVTFRVDGKTLTLNRYN